MCSRLATIILISLICAHAYYAYTFIVAGIAFKIEWHECYGKLMDFKPVSLMDEISDYNYHDFDMERIRYFFHPNGSYWMYQYLRERCANKASSLYGYRPNFFVDRYHDERQSHGVEVPAATKKKAWKSNDRFTTAFDFQVDIMVHACECFYLPDSPSPSLLGGTIMARIGAMCMCAVIFSFVIVELFFFWRSRRIASSMWKRLSRVRCCTARKERDIHVCRESHRARSQYAKRVVTIARPLLFILLAIQSLRLSVIYQLYDPVESARRFKEGDDEFPPGHPFFDGMNDSMIQFLLSSEMLPAFALYILFAFMSLNGSNPSAISLDLCNTSVSAMWIWRYVTLIPKWYTYFSSPIWVGRILQALLFGNSRLTMVLQTLVTTADVFAAIAKEIARSDGGAAGAKNNTSFGLMGYVFSETIKLGLMCCIILSFEHVQSSEAKLLVATRRSKHASELAHRLLGAMSDAVVHLDADLRVSRPCPHLGSLVLSSSDLKGQSLASHMHIDDRERFESSIKQAADVYVFHARLIDANRSAFSVEMFCASIAAEDEGVCYIIGIKEATDTDREDRVNLAEGYNCKVPIPEHRSLTQLTFGDSIVALSDSVSSSHPSEDSESSCFGEQSLDNVTAWASVDVATPELNIVCCSDSLKSLMPLEGCSTISDLFRARDIPGARSYLRGGGRIRPPTVNIMPRLPNKPQISATLVLCDDLIDTIPTLIGGSSRGKESEGSQESERDTQRKNKIVSFTLREFKEDLSDSEQRKILILVRVKDLKVFWTQFGRSCKIKHYKKFNTLIRSTHVLPLAKPDELMNVLQRWCQQFLDHDGQHQFEAPDTIGSFILDFSPDRSMQSFVPRLNIGIVHFTDVRRSDIGRSRVLLEVAIRFTKDKTSVLSTRYSL